MKRIAFILSLAASLAGMTPLAHAGLNDFLESVNIQAKADKNGFTTKLSAQFGIPESNVKLIVGAVSDPADAFMVLQLGQMAHKDPDDVLRLYQRGKGKGWGKLAQELGIKPGSPEFHALKNGNLSFTGEKGGNAVAQGGGQGRGPGHGPGNSSGRGNGRGKNKD